MKTVVILGINKFGRKVAEKVSVPNTSDVTTISELASTQFDIVKVSAVMTEAAFNQVKEV